MNLLETIEKLRKMTVASGATAEEQAIAAEKIGQLFMAHPELVAVEGQVYQQSGIGGLPPAWPFYQQPAPFFDPVFAQMEANCRAMQEAIQRQSEQAAAAERAESLREHYRQENARRKAKAMKPDSIWRKVFSHA